jgi:hypothetical protein
MALSALARFCRRLTRLTGIDDEIHLFSKSRR